MNVHADFRGEQVWFHVITGSRDRDSVGTLRDAAWCYPQPLPGRENICSCLTFSTGKGVGVRLL